MSSREQQLPSVASLRAIAALRSPHLATVRPARIGLGFEVASSNHKSLAEIEALLGGPGRLSLPYSLRWLLDVLAGLSVLHRTMGFVHGEAQPEHIVLGEDGVGRLIPVVRGHWARGEERTRARLYYLAPEKLLGDSVDGRADVFSVGVMLWEALSGRRLLEVDAIDDIIARLMGGGIPRAQAPEGEAWTSPLVDIAERALSVDPGRRFGSVGEMKANIEGVCQRYLASAPGMAELFQNPQLRARGYVRDSRPPESQRTSADRSCGSLLPPAVDEESVTQVTAPRPSEGTVTQVITAEQLKEAVARTNAAEPDPQHSGQHIPTLLGVPAPPAPSREPASGPDSVTTPFARLTGSTAPPVVIPTVAPSGPEPPLAPRPFGETRSQFNVGRLGTEASAAGITSVPAASAAPPPIGLEPSFELVRPRRRRGAVWLVFGAGLAVMVLAARPWLIEQVTALRGDAPAPAATRKTSAPVVVDVSSNASSSPAPSAPGPASIASTPASPVRGAARRRAPREEHVVIDDRLDPEPATPGATPDTASPKPTAAEPAREPSPTVPTPPAVPKQVPLSDADRYGI